MQLVPLAISSLCLKLINNLKKISLNPKKLLPKSSFAKSVSVLAGGTAAGQFIVVAASPILTRLYSPEDFGLLAVYGGILGILGVVASLRYELAIPLPEYDRKAASVAVLCLVVVVVMALLTALVFGLFGSEIINILNTPSLQPYLWLVPLGVFLMGVYQAFQYWAIRTKAFSAIAKTRMSQSLGMVVVQVAGYTLGPLALLLGRVVGHSAGIFGLVRSALKKHSKAFSSTTYTEVRQAAVEYRSFPIVSTWTGLASSGGANLPPLLIAIFIGAGPAGIFALTHRVLSQPMAVIGKAVGDVFYREAAQAHREGKLLETIDRVFSTLVLLAFPPAVMIFLVTPEAFVIIFGDSWKKAGEIARWMTPWLFFQFVVTPSTRIYPILGMHGVALRFQLSLLFSSVLSIIIGGVLLKSLTVSVVLMSMLNSAIYVWRVIYTYMLVGGKWNRPLFFLSKYLLLAILCNSLFLFSLYFEGKVINFRNFSGVLTIVSFFVLVFVTVLNVKRLRLQL